MYSSYLKNGDRNTIYSCERSTIYSQLNPNQTSSINISITDSNSGVINYGIEESGDITKDLLVAVCKDGLVTKSSDQIYSITKSTMNGNAKGTGTIYGGYTGSIYTTTTAGYVYSK
jgi:hypothetical protein